MQVPLRLPDGIAGAHGFDLRRAFWRLAIVVAVTVIAYALMIAFSTRIASAIPVPGDLLGMQPVWIAAGLLGAAVPITVLAGELRLLLPLALPPVTAVLDAVAGLSADLRERGINDLVPRDATVPYFQVSVALGLAELIAVAVIVTGGFFYVAAGHGVWDEKRRVTMTTLFFVLVICALAASLALILR